MNQIEQTRGIELYLLDACKNPSSYIHACQSDTLVDVCLAAVNNNWTAFKVRVEFYTLVEDKKVYATTAEEAISNAVNMGLRRIYLEVTATPNKEAPHAKHK